MDANQSTSFCVLHIENKVVVGIRAEESDINSVVVPAGVEAIGVKAFSSCTGLTLLTLPDTLTSVGYYAFFSCILGGHLSLGARHALTEQQIQSTARVHPTAHSQHRQKQYSPTHHPQHSPKMRLREEEDMTATWIRVTDMSAMPL